MIITLNIYDALLTNGKGSTGVHTNELTLGNSSSRTAKTSAIFHSKFLFQSKLELGTGKYVIIMTALETYTMHNEACGKLGHRRKPDQHLTGRVAWQAK